MNELEDSVATFFTAVGNRLEDAVRNFKAGNSEAAIREMEGAVELCEEHPPYAIVETVALGSSLQKVVHGCISNAIAKGRTGANITELLARIEAVARPPLH